MRLFAIALSLPIALSLLYSAASLAGSTGLGLKDLDDETRASVIKEMSKMKRYGDGSQHRRNGAQSNGNDQNGCNMNVGSAQNQGRPTGPTPRRVVTVVTGSVVQLCNQ